MGFKPTDEQERIMDAAASGMKMKIKAGAGSGKTSTLKLVANANPNTKFLFLAFGRTIKEDAERSFPRNVTCLTTHGMASRAMGSSRYPARLKFPRQNGREAARILGIREPIWTKKDLAPLAPEQIGRIVKETVKNFCYSSDSEFTKWNVPRQPGLEEKADHEELAKAILPWAKRAWDDILDKNGLLRYEHDYYLKRFTLSGQKMREYDVVLLDEAQDSNPCLTGYLSLQDTNIIPVGDSAQAIFGWRGAVDAISKFPGEEFLLTKSFRFGQGVADEANKWLETMDGETLRIVGFEQLTSAITNLSIEQADAVICRTNAGTIRKAMEAFDVGLQPAIVGGTDAIEWLAKAAIELKSGRPTSHPELCLFRTWGEVQDYAEHDSGSDLLAFVRLVDSIGAEEILDICEQMVDPRYAKLKILTAHKAKGLEYNNVLVSDDFKEPAGNEKDSEPRISREDAMLAYVTVTRAKQRLDRGGLAFIDRFGPGGRLKPEHRARYGTPKFLQELERENITIVSPVEDGEDELVSCDFPMCHGDHTADQIKAGLGCISPEDLALAELDGETVEQMVQAFREEEDAAVVDVAPARSTLLIEAKPQVAVKSTCTCDPATAKKWANMLGQPAGPDASHCNRCGGGRSMG